ncbi:hypothetical protein [Nocardioides sp.]|uniref:hypothetical protein n=1 Tax=Nocardioides sp. TaxID=35761 RepID=UPI0035273459
MVVRHRVVALPLVHEPGAGWPADFLQRLLDPSPPGTRPEQRTTMADFWADSTCGVLRTTGRVLPPVLLSPEDPDWVAARHGADPDHRHRLALGALVRRCLDPASVRDATGLLVVGSLPVERAYTAELQVGRRTLQVAFVSDQTHHTILAHELGHVFGFEHPWGLATEVGNVLTREYGSPYCVMGTARRFDEVCTPVPAWAGAPADTAEFFRIAGPRVSLAELVAWGLRDRGRRLTAADASWLPWVRVPPGESVTVRLTDRDRAGPLPAGVVVETAKARRFVLEVRRPDPRRGVDWDGGLDLRRWYQRADREPSQDLHDGPGVVLHVLESLRRPATWRELLTNNGRRRAHRAVYVGTIPLPAAGDLDVTSAQALPWTARLLDADADGVTVLVSADAVVPRMDLRAERLDDDGWHWHVWAQTVGFERPEFSWQLAGERLPFQGVGHGHRQSWTAGRTVTPPRGGNPEWRPVRLDIQASWDVVCVHADRVAGSFPLGIRVSARDWIQLGTAAEAEVSLRLGEPAATDRARGVQASGGSPE